jgi:hypothetical protein
LPLFAAILNEMRGNRETQAAQNPLYGGSSRRGAPRMSTSPVTQLAETEAGPEMLIRADKIKAEPLEISPKEFTPLPDQARPVASFFWNGPNDLERSANILIIDEGKSKKWLGYIEQRNDDDESTHYSVLRDRNLIYICEELEKKLLESPDGKKDPAGWVPEQGFRSYPSVQFVAEDFEGKVD